MKLVKALRIATAIGIVLSSAAGMGAVWNANFDNTKPNEVRRSEKRDERDMITIIPSSAYTDGWMTFAVRPEGEKVPFRLVAYSIMNKEIARTSSIDGGPASLTVPVQVNIMAYFRMIPIGSRFDPPEGAKVTYGGVPATGTNQIKLPAYSFATIPVRDGKGATSEQFAALQMSAGATASAPPPPPQPEYRNVFGGLMIATGKPATPKPSEGSLSSAARPTLGSTPAQPATGFVPAAAVAASGPVKSWGSLAQMAGTTWINDDQALEFEWATPQEVMLITRKGIYGEIQTIVSGSADGKALRYVTRDVYSGEQTEGQVGPSNGRFVLRYDAVGRIACKLPKPGQTGIACDVQSQAGKSWSASTIAYRASDKAGATAMLAKLPGIFPARSEGKYDRQIGPFAYLGIGRWADQSGTPIIVNGARGPSGITLQVAPPVYGLKNAMFEQQADGRLAATIVNATEKNPQGKAISYLEVLKGGVGRICYVSYGTTYCSTWRASADGQKIMREGNEGRTIFQQVALPQRSAKKDGLLGSLHDRAFRDDQGKSIEFTNFSAPGTPKHMWISFYKNDGYLSLTCSTKTETSVSCRYTEDFKSYEYDSKLAEDGADRFAFNGSVYTITPNGDLVATSNSGSQHIYHAASPGEMAYLRQAQADAEKIDSAYVSRRMTQESNDAVWRGIAAGIAEMPNTMRQWQKDNAFLAPTDWAQRIGAVSGGGNVGGGNATRVSTGGAAGKVGGYAQSMGSTIFVPLTPESAEYRMKREEIERYEIRKRLYGDKDATTGPNDIVKATMARGEYLREESARMEVERAEQEAKDAEARAQEQEANARNSSDRKVAEDARKIADDARAAAEKTRVDAARNKARADAEARAEADRKRQEDEVTVQKARVEKARVEEAARQEAEDKRARSQMANYVVTGSMNYGPLAPRREPQSGPGQGSLSKSVPHIAGCNANGVQVRYNLSGLMGEAVVNGTWSWTSNEKCSLPSNTVVWLKLQSNNAWGYVRLDPAVPAANAGSGYTSASSPPWSELVCSFRGSGPGTCLDEKRAKDLWASGVVTGFEIAW